MRSEKKNPGATSHWSRAFAGSIDAGIVVAEIPARRQSCEIRKTVFSWTHAKLPFSCSIWQKVEDHSAADHHCCRQSIFRHQPCSRRPIEPENRPSRLRSLRNSSCDEADSSVNRACQLVLFSCKLPSMEAEIDCKLQSNSSKNRNRSKNASLKEQLLGRILVRLKNLEGN